MVVVKRMDLLWEELKYALRIHPIIKAIETKYGITF